MKTTENPLLMSRDELENGLLKEFGSSSTVVSITLREPVHIEPNVGDETPAYLRYSFEDCGVAWVNPLIINESDKTFACPRIFAAGNKTSAELLTVARHFAGLVSFACDGAQLVEIRKTVKEASDSRLEVGEVPMQPQMFQGFPVGFMLETACSMPLGETEILSLAHMRQAANSSTPYWAYLSYWKIFEVEFGRVKRVKGQTNPIEAYINGASPVGVDPKWAKAHPNAFKRLYGTRKKIAHWQDDTDTNLKDPDDEKLFDEVTTDLPVLQAYVRSLINPKFGLNPY